MRSMVGLADFSVNRAWIVLFLCSSASFFLSAVNTAHSSILTLIMGDLNLNYTEGGLLTTAYFAGYALGQIPGGHLADRFKTGKIIALSTLGSSVFMFLFGGAMEGSLVILWRFLGGLVGAGIFVPSVTMISAWFPSEKIGTALGFFGTASSLGPIFSAPLSFIVAQTYGWRWSIWFFTALGFPIFALGWTMLTEKVSRGQDKEKVGRIKEKLLEQRSFWILGFAQFVRMGVNYTLLSWLPTLLKEAFGIEPFLSSLSIVAMSGIGICSNSVGGLVSDRVGEKTVILSSLSVMVLAFCLLFVVKELAAVWIAIIFFGWFLGFMRSPIFAILPRLYGFQRIGRAAGYQNTFASIGALALPLVLGYTRDSTGSFDTGWLVLSIFCIVASITTLSLNVVDKSTKRKKSF